jgi:hypothetical protein
MKYFLMILLLGCGNAVSQAQTAEQSGKWEIGLNILPLIDSSFYIVRSSTTGFHTIGAFPTQLMVRYKLNEKWKLRSNIGFVYSDVESRPDERPEVFLISQRVLGTAFLLGFEHCVTKGRIGVYFGASIGGYYLKSVYKDEYDNRPYANPPIIYKIRDFYSEAQIGLNGITGVNVKIFQNFYINFESNLILAYRHAKNDFQRFNGEQLVLTVEGGGNKKRYLADLRPLSAIQIIYNF